MPKGVPKNGAKRKRKECNKTQFSSHYVIKVGLRSLLANHLDIIPKIQERAMDMTRVSIRLTRFINLFVLRLLENKKTIPQFDQGFIQRILSVLFGRHSSDRTKNVSLINTFVNMDDAIDKLRVVYSNISTLLVYLSRMLHVSISNMLKFTLVQRLNKYLPTRIEESITEAHPKSEQRRVVDFIVRKLTFTTPVFDFRKTPPMELIKLIPILIKEVQTLIECDPEQIVTEAFIDANPEITIRFYWHLQN